jgi:4-amino-4-deoxy-L-arabinose transferase-like glycosyltransferase
MVPLGEGVDEAAHFDYVLFVKDQHRLPVQRPEQGHIDTPMGHHPPFYYILASVLISPIDTSDRPAVLHANPHFVWDTQGAQGWNVVLPEGQENLLQGGTLLAFRLVRLFNIALGSVVILCTYLATRQLLPLRPWAPLGAAAIVGLNPSFIYMASTIHHDVLQAALYSAGLLWCVHYTSRRISLTALCAAGVLIASAALTKLSGISLGAVVCLTLISRTRQAQDWGHRWLQVLVAGAVAGLLGGWWFVRNQILYGDPVGWRMFLTVFAHTARRGPFNWWLFVHDFLAGFERTFWGAFGFMHILLPRPVWLVAWGLTGIALAGWLCILWRIWRQHIVIERTTLVRWLVVITGLSLLFLSFVRMAFSVIGAGHGRYLFPGVIAIGAVLIAGMNGYAAWRWQKPISLALLCGMAAYAIWAPITYVWPKYRLPPTVDLAGLPDLQATNLGFENGLRLVGIQTSSSVVIPGQGLDVTTFWSSDPQTNPTFDPYVTISLNQEDGQPLGTAEFWPELSTVPYVWGQRIIANKQSFYIPPEQKAGKLRIQLAISNGRGGQPLGVQPEPGRTTVDVAEILTLGQVIEVPATEVPTANASARFGEAIELVAVELPAEVTPGTLLPVQLYWKVLAPVPRDYTVFVHVLDGAGKMAAQLDRPPGGGTSPTSSWRPGTYLRDTYPVTLPPGLASGRYRVRMGLYTWPELTRQPIALDNSPVGDELPIGEVLIAP